MFCFLLNIELSCRFVYTNIILQNSFWFVAICLFFVIFYFFREIHFEIFFVLKKNTIIQFASLISEICIVLVIFHCCERVIFPTYFFARRCHQKKFVLIFLHLLSSCNISLTGELFFQHICWKLYFIVQTDSWNYSFVKLISFIISPEWLILHQIYVHLIFHN
jgi:hypothetical protein